MKIKLKVLGEILGVTKVVLTLKLGKALRFGQFPFLSALLHRMELGRDYSQQSEKQKNIVM